MIDDDGVGPALGLRALARVVDDERVEQRHVGDRQVGIAVAREGQRLARQPLQGAVLAEVDDGVGTPSPLRRPCGEPLVAGQVVVRRGQIRRVVRADRIGAEPARRLDRHQDAAEVDAGEHESVAVGDVDLAGGRAPHRLHAGPSILSHGIEPGAVGVDRPGAGGCGHLAGGEHRLVVGEPGGQLVHQGVAVDRDALDAVAGVTHGVEQQDRRGRGVQPDRVAEAGALRRVGGQHDHDPLDGVGDPSEPGRAHGEAGQPVGALGVGTGGDDRRSGVAVVVDDLLEGERRPDDAPVELGDGDPRGHVERAEPGVGGQPGST